MSSKADDQLALSAGLTLKTNQLCLGLESGAADILDLVTPTTAELLKWWFGEDMVLARGGLNFHAGQQQAILNAIVAHEVLGRDSANWTLLDLYRACAPDALLTGTRLNEVASPKHGHPKYCFKMATGTGKTWVMQALMVWQLLNKTAALAEGIDDARFTRQFMVVAPGLIVYERLLDAFCGKLVEGGNGSARDFATSDIARFADLFIPDAYRDQVFAFVRGNVCSKTEIGLKATGNGMIAITNWHLLNEGDAADEVEDADNIETLGAPLEPQQVINAVLPLMPGRATGNSLDVLDRRYARGNVLEFLAGLPELMVFNDEAHHIHSFLREGETTEVEWQKSLSRIAATKGRRFVQVDFSATPYNDVGSGKNKRKLYFAHIVTDFDLKSAMRAGLVKSLVLDRRKEIGALPLEFKAERDADGQPVLSEGQRVMLRAGLQKLRKLETDFAKIDPARFPKMLVVCEDTTVSPLVAAFLHDEGLGPDEVMTIDSGKKAELGEKDWLPVRQRLFSVDHHASPKVIVSVLMLREGFDVNNICVIVPLRSSQAQILLEQTIGRGLRLMWRDDEYTDLKRENRERINAGQEPGSLLDVLSIVEHPAFQSFYDDLIREGLAGATGDMKDTSATGDVMAAELREGFAAFDFGIPFILQEADEVQGHHAFDLAALPAFTAMTAAQLGALLGKGDTFISQDLQSATLFGDYRVDGAVMNVGGYNEYLARLTRRISQALSEPVPKGNKIATHLAKPYLQVNTAELAGWLDDYIWTQLFDAAFNPLDDENWRLLLLQPVVDHITKVFAVALLESEQKHVTGQTEVLERHLSEVPRLMMRESHSVEVSKCIYTRLAWPAHSGGLERAFIHWAQADTQTLAFCKISENRHTFARLRYVKDDGLPAFYSPDFMVRTEGAIYLVETKAQQQTIHPNVQRKLKAATAWCERINGLPAKQRGSLPWHYVLLAEDVLLEWQAKGARLAELLDYARLRPLADSSAQGKLL